MATKTKAKENGQVNRVKAAMEATDTGAASGARVEIPPPKLKVVEIRIIGTSPLVLHRFGEKARQQLHDTHAEGKSSKSRKNREAKDFQANFRSAQHVIREQDGGGYGIPAAAFRNACIDACRLADVAMTVAKQCIFVLADGIGTDGTQLVRIDAGEPEYSELPVRNASGVVDLRARPMWSEWAAVVRVRFDADMLRAADVANLLMRAGVQVGIGEGRPFSKKSNGLGWGTFRIDGFEEEIDE